MKITYIDLEQAESRVVGAISLRLFGDSTYLDACESGDLHSLVCSMCWTKLPWPADFTLAALKASNEKTFPPDLLTAAKKVAKVLAYRDMSYRDLAKRLGHGTNYQGQPPHMAKHTHVKLAIIQAFQDEYFGAFPSLARWHRWCAEELETKGSLTTMLGRCRHFFGRPDNAATLREFVAFEPQSVATGDYMNAGLLRLFQANFPLLLNKQVHDAIAFSYDERDEHWLLPEACRILSWTFPLNPNPDRLSLLQSKRKLLRRETEDLNRLLQLQASPRPFSIPTEALIGWNLAYRKKDKKTSKVTNPNGLIPFSPDNPDTRFRIETPPVSMTEHFTSEYLQ